MERLGIINFKPGIHPPDRTAVQFGLFNEWSMNPFQSYKLKKDSEAECKDKNDLTLFGAGSLFGYVPLLSGVATLKRHDARRGLLLTTTISSCILAAYDVSEALSQVFHQSEGLIILTNKSLCMKT